MYAPVGSGEMDVGEADDVHATKVPPPVEVLTQPLFTHPPSNSTTCSAWARRRASRMEGYLSALLN